MAIKAPLITSCSQLPTSFSIQCTVRRDTLFSGCISLLCLLEMNKVRILCQIHLNALYSTLNFSWLFSNFSISEVENGLSSWLSTSVGLIKGPWSQNNIMCASLWIANTAFGGLSEWHRVFISPHYREHLSTGKSACTVCWLNTLLWSLSKSKVLWDLGSSSHLNLAYS